MVGDRRARRAGELCTGMVAARRVHGLADALGRRSPRGAYDVYFTFRAERKPAPPAVSATCDATFETPISWI